VDSKVEHEHGTALAIGARAVLIRGASGSGKSDLALRCILQKFDDDLIGKAMLVADDQVLLARRGDKLFVRAPATIAGLLEVRGQGPLRFPHVDEAHLMLIAELTQPSEVERLPERRLTAMLAGVTLPLLRLAPFETSAPAKLLLALSRAGPRPRGN